MNLLDYIKQESLKGIMLELSRPYRAGSGNGLVYGICNCGHCFKTSGYLVGAYDYRCPTCGHHSHRSETDGWARFVITSLGCLELLKIEVHHESALRVDCYRLSFIHELRYGKEPTSDQILTKPFDHFETMIHHLDGRAEFTHPNSEMSLQRIVIGDTSYERETVDGFPKIIPSGMTGYGDNELIGHSYNKGMAIFNQKTYWQPSNCLIEVGEGVKEHRVFQRHPIYAFENLFKVRSIGEFFHTFYYFHWMLEKYPAFEQVAKSGYHSFIEHWLDLYFQEPTKRYQVHKSLKRGTKESQIIPVPIFIRRWIKQRNASFETYKKLLQIHEVSPIGEETFELFLEIEHDLELTRIWRIIRDQEISFNEMMQYLGQCYTRQAIPYGEALILWDDYLTLAKRCELPAKKFPPSVKLAHDVMLKHFNEIGDVKYAEQFAEQATKNQQWEYQDETLGFSLIVPKTIRELVEEGRTLRHCVGSYDRRVAKGETVILFLRQNHQLKKPLYTIEWNPEERVIVQAKGKLNHSISDPTALKMLDQFKANFAL